MTMIQPKTIVISGLTGKLPLNRHQVYCPEPDTTEMDADGPRKRKRLTHLSQDERMLRRKLKNRVAAQTARDRKKQRMEELEEAMIKLEEENQKLQNENMKLKNKTENLLEENMKMKTQLGDSDVAMVGGYAPPESAELDNSPQQQVMKARTLLNLTTHCIAFLMTLSVTNSLDYSSKSQRSLLPQLKHKLKRLQQEPALMKSLTPRLKQHLREKWWGPQQRSWTPSKN